VVITKKGSPKTKHTLSSGISLVEAGHPLPDQQSVLGAQQVVNTLSKASSGDLIICNISGGGSSLLTYPKPGIKLEEIQILTKQLLACGATIDEINAIRKHIDVVKGGGLLDKARSSQWITLILSDVIGDPIDRIASGPTAPDPSTYEEAYEIIQRYQLLDMTPFSIINHLKQGLQKQSPETLKPGNSIFNRVYNLIIGNNSLAAAASLREAERAGFKSILLTTSLQGEASQVGLFFGAIAHQITLTGQPIPRPACILAGGETTVTLRGKGLGGRNQEAALGSVISLAGLDKTFYITLATDGGDGPTDAAGAVVSGNTYTRAQTLGLNPRDYLDRNDSYHFFEPLGDLIKTGQTLTNVGDLNFLFAL
jgi:glycerate 2-kinase